MDLIIIVHNRTKRSETIKAAGPERPASQKTQGRGPEIKETDRKGQERPIRAGYIERD